MGIALACGRQGIRNAEYRINEKTDEWVIGVQSSKLKTQSQKQVIGKLCNWVIEAQSKTVISDWPEMCAAERTIHDDICLSGKYIYRCFHFSVKEKK